MSLWVNDDMRDSFFDEGRQLKVLLEQYEKHGKIIVAFDFDDTVSPFRGESCEQVKELLRDLRPYAHMICFTARTSENQLFVKEYLKDNNIPYDYINKEWDGSEITGKLFYNQLLDDKAGLFESYMTLYRFLTYATSAKTKELATQLLNEILDENGWISPEIKQFAYSYEGFPDYVKKVIRIYEALMVDAFPSLDEYWGDDARDNHISVIAENGEEYIFRALDGCKNRYIELDREKSLRITRISNEEQFYLYFWHSR